MFKKLKLLILLITPLVLISSCGKTINKQRADSVDKSCYFNERLMNDTKTYNVYFGFDSAEISLKERAKLRTGLNLLEVLPEDSCVSLIGYTDKIGNPVYNRKLAQRRVDAVKSYLNELGYKNVNIDVQEAVGRSKLPTHCEGLGRQDKIDCMAELRRVEVIVLYPAKR